MTNSKNDISSSSAAALSSTTTSTTKTIRTLSPQGGWYMSELIIKKSRFLAYAHHANNWNQAKEYIDEIRLEHAKARHACYGFLCGINPVQERCSDDGEPTGTAGVPILGAIKGEELSDVVCVVVRYFGGIKLGAGGLIRAYGSAARQVLREASIEVVIPKTSFVVKVEAGYVGSVYESVAKTLSATTCGESYGLDGSMIVTITCNIEQATILQEILKDATRGSIQFFEQNNDQEEEEEPK